MEAYNPREDPVCCVEIWWPRKECSF